MRKLAYHLTRLLVALAFLLAVQLTALADDWKDGNAAFNRGDYATALELLRPLAEHGHPGAQAMLGVLYEHGYGVPQDYGEAAKWYRKAAEHGLAPAQTYLGERYHNGQGVPKDYAEARKWYSKAAEQGFAYAQHLLGGMHYSGHGVPQDYAEAADWHRKAAEQGLADAQYMLGTLYFLGQGVPQDNVQAYMWLTLAADWRDIDGGGVSHHHEAAIYRDLLAGRMTSSQIAEAQRLAREWAAKHPQ